jgi:DNA invertase Pin-like site-specific DNA recombinase
MTIPPFRSPHATLFLEANSPFKFPQKQKGNRMQVIGYIRVSSVNKEDQRAGHQNQLDGIERWCSYNGHELIATYSDLGVSGMTHAINRPGWNLVLNELRGRRNVVVLSNGLDRFARSPETIAATIAPLQDAGHHAAETEDGLYPQVEGETPIGKFMRVVRLGMVGYQRDDIIQRLDRGKATKRRSQGLKPIDKDLDREMQSLRSEGFSDVAIAEHLGISRNTVAKRLAKYKN